MDSAEVIESYLIRSGVGYETLEDGLWMVHDEVDHVDNIVIRHSPPVLLFRVKLMDVPADPKARADLFRKLLELNARELLAGAYGLEGGSVVLCETLQTENLDYNEFQAALDGLTFALTEHYQTLKTFHTTTHRAEASA